MVSATPAYAALVAGQLRLHRLQHLQAMATWDRMVQMPGGGAAQARSAAQAEFAALLQDLRDDPAHDAQLARAEQEALAPHERRNLALMQRNRRRVQAVPAALVAQREALGSAAMGAWMQARAENDWARFSSALSPLLALVREEAARLGEALNLQPYDALLDGFEPGLTGMRVQALFGEVAQWLPDLLEHAIARQATTDVIEPVGPFPVAAQKALGERVMRAIGFDFGAGRLDVSTHPFTGGVPEDVRLTTRYDEADCLSALRGTLHETGHACYQQHLPRHWLGQPLAEPPSAALHEGQALSFERQLAPTAAFTRWLSPLLAEAFGAQPAFEPHNLLRLWTRVRRGFIRIEADELSYPAHVILRGQIEQALFDGRIEVDDIPAWWDERMHALLGLDTRGDFRRGPLQDVHWCQGMFGYFPAYLLGAMAAAQLRAAMARDLGDLDTQIERGNFSAITGWLDTRIWQQGSLADGEELLRRATGQGYTPAVLRAHFEQRYLGAAA